MSVADKLSLIAENEPKVYEAGKLAVLKDSKYMNASVSGAVVVVNDVNPIEHDVDVKLKSNRNLYNAQITRVAEWDGATSADTKREFKEGVWYVGLTGNNYWNPKQIMNYSTSEGAVTFTAKLALYGMSQAFQCQPQQKYYFSCETSEQLAQDKVCWFGFYEADGGHIHFARWDPSTGYIITPKNCYWVTVCPCGSPNVAVTYSNIQLSTEPIDSYTPCPDFSAVTVKQYGESQTPQTYQAEADGTVNGVKSLSPSMTLMTDTDGVTIECSYLRDIDTYIDNVTVNVALTGGV